MKSYYTNIELTGDAEHPVRFTVNADEDGTVIGELSDTEFLCMEMFMLNRSAMKVGDLAERIERVVDAVASRMVGHLLNAVLPKADGIPTAGPPEWIRDIIGYKPPEAEETATRTPQADLDARMEELGWDPVTRRPKGM